MLTRKNKTKKNKTKKNKNMKPSLKLLKVGYPLYAAKQFTGDKILEYNRMSEIKSQNPCFYNNSGWFGSLDVAKSYKTENNTIYKFEVKKTTNLLINNITNKKFIKYIFETTQQKLVPTIKLNNKQINKINYQHPYIKMPLNEKAYYEYCFVFGYINVKEQYEFLKLIKYLIENNFVIIKRRSGDSILNKINIKIMYYKANIFNKKNMYNRISFYNFDKHALMNLCNIVKNRYNISGILVKNTTSFWFPNLIIYKMNIEEFIFFNPHKNLKYIKPL